MNVVDRGFNRVCVREVAVIARSFLPEAKTRDSWALMNCQSRKQFWIVFGKPLFHAIGTGPLDGAQQIGNRTAIALRLHE